MKKIIVVIVVNKFSITLLVLQIWEICQTKKKKERILYYNFMYNIRDFYLYKYLKKKKKERERDFHIWKVKYISVFVCKDIIEQCTYVIGYFAKYFLQKDV